MIFAANFKSNHSRASFKEYARLLCEFWSEFDKKDDEIIIFPPFSAFCGCALKGKKISLGAQNFYPADNGAFTGEICADMLSEFDINSVLVGHSERRALG
ncbi:MAG: triose-phosphate isomerase, partial [Campylobacter sp.]|nr:triose-phosphate isomerase [Campylobacter sp.]